MKCQTLLDSEKVIEVVPEGMKNGEIIPEKSIICKNSIITLRPIFKAVNINNLPLKFHARDNSSL